MKRILTIAIISLLVFSGCAWLEPKEEKSIEELANNGMEEFKNENYKTAIEYFEKLRDWYPFSKYAILAELKISDSYYKLKDYEEAISAYEEFVNLHPRNEAISYVIYQIGLCYFEQIDSVDRDQTTAQKAFDTFKKLIKQFPKNAYANRARVKLKKCLKSLAGHEFYVGSFYYKNKHYKAALSRFEAVLSNYPDVGVQHEALKYIALCKKHIKYPVLIQPNMPDPKGGAEVDRFQEVRQIDIDTEGISGESPHSDVTRQQGKKTREQQTVVETPNLEEANIQKEVSAFLQRWREAWENSAGKQGDMENFTSLYADDFRPHGGHSRSAWMADKAMKNRRKSWIKVKLSDVRISDLKEGNEAQVKFLQAYSSSNFSEKNSKTFILRKEESGWKIVSVKLGPWTK